MGLPMSPQYWRLAGLEHPRKEGLNRPDQWLSIQKADLEVQRQWLVFMSRMPLEMILVKINVWLKYAIFQSSLDLMDDAHTYNID